MMSLYAMGVTANPVVMRGIIQVGWVNPTDPTFDHVEVYRRTDTFQTSRTDSLGTLVYSGTNTTIYDFQTSQEVAGPNLATTDYDTAVSTIIKWDKDSQTHAELAEGQTYYYTVFSIMSDGSNYSSPATMATARAFGDVGWEDRLWTLLPDIYNRSDTLNQNADPSGQNYGSLRRLLWLLALYLDWTQEKAKGILDFNSPNRCEPWQLPYLANQLGWPLDTTLALNIQRSSINTAVQVYQSAGTRKALDILVKYYSGFPLTSGIVEGSAILLHSLLFSSSSQSSQVWYLDNVCPDFSENRVINSGFEIFTTTATLFSDSLTSYTGTTVPAPWNLAAGTSVSFSASGALFNGGETLLQSSGYLWQPLTGSDGSNLPIKSQITFTTSSTNQASEQIEFGFRDKNGNDYRAYVNGGGTNNLSIWKLVNGVQTSVSTVAYTWAAATTYTGVLSLDAHGNLVASVYSGTSATGTAVVTTNGTSTDLNGPFCQYIGGDNGPTLTNASVIGPWANGWTIGGDSRVAWGLIQSALDGKCSLSGVGVGSGVLGNARSSDSITYSTGIPYTVSADMSTTNIGGGGAYVQFGNTAPPVTGTTSSTRQGLTTTLSSATYGSGGTTGSVWLNINDSGTVVFDDVQLSETNVMYNYLENDSLTGSAHKMDFSKVGTAQDPLHYCYDFSPANKTGSTTFTASVQATTPLTTDQQTALQAKLKGILDQFVPVGVEYTISIYS